MSLKFIALNITKMCVSISIKSSITFFSVPAKAEAKLTYFSALLRWENKKFIFLGHKRHSDFGY
jgi:hypothetical protein